MSLSKKEREENIELGLRLMMEDLGERGVDEVLFEIDKPRFDEIYPTTWQYFEDRYIIKPMHTMGRKLCQLTGGGWLEGLEIIGTLETQETKEKVGKVMAAIKNQVKGRNDKRIVHSHEIAAETGLPEGLVHNIILSDYIRHVLKCKSVYWQPLNRGYLVEIPVDFGLEILF